MKTIGLETAYCPLEINYVLQSTESSSKSSTNVLKTYKFVQLFHCYLLALILQDSVIYSVELMTFVVSPFLGSYEPFMLY